jgi:hypothetical protein
LGAKFVHVLPLIFLKKSVATILIMVGLMILFRGFL